LAAAERDGFSGGCKRESPGFRAAARATSCSRPPRAAHSPLSGLFKTGADEPLVGAKRAETLRLPVAGAAIPKAPGPSQATTPRIARREKHVACALAARFGGRRAGGRPPRIPVGVFPDGFPSNGLEFKGKGRRGTKVRRLFS